MRACWVIFAAQLAAAHAFVAPRPWARRSALPAVSESAQQGWTEYYDEEQQRPYYHNANTGETTWDAPAAAPAAAAVAAPAAAAAAAVGEGGLAGEPNGPPTARVRSTGANARRARR